MAFPSVYDKVVTQGLIDRVNALTPETTPDWGKMNVDQMLAHVNVAYEMALTDKHPKANAFMTFMLKTFVKGSVVGEKPYKRNTRTAPAFIIEGPRDFEEQKKILLDNLTKTQALGASHFEGHPSPSFGNLTAVEWSNLFYKHLDHHLTQFGV